MSLEALSLGTLFLETKLLGTVSIEPLSRALLLNFLYNIFMIIGAIIFLIMSLFVIIALIIAPFVIRDIGKSHKYPQANIKHPIEYKVVDIETFELSPFGTKTVLTLDKPVLFKHNQNEFLHKTYTPFLKKQRLYLLEINRMVENKIYTFDYHADKIALGDTIYISNA